MIDTILQKNIAIASAQDTGIQIKIKDADGRTYSFFKSKKDGSSTQAFNQFGQYKVGDRTGISYKEVPFIGKDGTQATIKNIIGFMPVMQETISKGERTMQNLPIIPEYKEMPIQPEVKGTDAFGRRLAIHGMINGILASGVKPTDINIGVIIQVDMLENRINEFLSIEEVKPGQIVETETDQVPLPEF